jgi:hypothetical protein
MVVLPEQGGPQITTTVGTSGRIPRDTPLDSWVTVTQGNVSGTIGTWRSGTRHVPYLQGSV